MPTADLIFRTSVQNTVYVTTESGEIGVVLQELGYWQNDNHGHTYYLGANRDHAMTARVDDLGLTEALLKQAEIGFHPQARIILNCNGDQRSYERNASRLVEALSRQGQWYAVCGLGKPFVHKEDLGRPKILGRIY